jgi:hypothetical protein
MKILAEYGGDFFVDVVRVSPTSTTSTTSTRGAVLAVGTSHHQVL